MTTIRLIPIENEEHEKLARLIGELKGQSESIDAMLDDMFAKVINASAIPRYVFEATTPEELQCFVEKFNR